MSRRLPINLKWLVSRLLRVPINLRLITDEETSHIKVNLLWKQVTNLWSWMIKTSLAEFVIILDYRVVMRIDSLHRIFHLCTWLTCTFLFGIIKLWFALLAKTQICKRLSTVLFSSQFAAKQIVKQIMHLSSCKQQMAPFLLDYFGQAVNNSLSRPIFIIEYLTRYYYNWRSL